MEDDPKPNKIQSNQSQNLSPTMPESLSGFLAGRKQKHPRTRAAS
jgi:hypothetical protein